MRNFILITTLISIGAIAENVSNDFSRSTGDKQQKLLQKDISERLKVTGEIYYLSKDGALLAKAGEWREWTSVSDKMELVSNWFYDSDRTEGPMAITHKWSIDDKGRILVNFKQFKEMERGKNRKVITKGLIWEKNFILSSFEALSIELKELSPDEKVIVRLTPSLVDLKSSLKLSKFPLVTDDMSIIDSEQRLWAQNLNLQGQYLGVKTHLGTVELSFEKFPGSKELGFASDNEIILKLGGKKGHLNLKSMSPIVPKGTQAKVYAVVDESKRSQGRRSVQTSASDNLESFEKHRL